MNSSEIVKRIMELKKVSVELKQTTEEKKNLDSNLLRGILEMGKGLSTHKKSSEDSPTAFSIANFIQQGGKKMTQYSNENDHFSESRVFE